MIPEVIRQLGIGFVAFVEAIGNGGAAILSAISTIISSILDALIQNLPKFFTVISLLINGILDLIIEYAPKIVEAGFTILMSLLKGIRDNIQEIVEVGADIIINFIKGIENKMPELVDEAFNLIIVFIDTLGTTIRDKTPILVDHIWTMAENIIAGLWEGLKHAFNNGKEALTDLGTWIIEKLEDVFGIPHGSLKAGAKRFLDMGGQIITGMINGFKEGLGAIGKAVEEVGENIKEGFCKFFHIKSPSRLMRDEVGDQISEGLAVGINDNKSSEEASEEKSKEIIETFKNLLNEDETKSIGSSVSTNIATGIKTNKDPEKAAKEKAQKIAEAFKKELDKIDIKTQTEDLGLKLWEASRVADERYLERALEEEYSKDVLNESYIRELEDRQTAMELEKRDMEIKLSKNNLSDLREKERISKEEYDAYVKTFGSESDEAKKAYNTYLQAQITTIEKLNEIDQMEYEHNKNKAQIAEEQRLNNEALENSYYNWIINNTKALKQVGYTNDQIKKAAKNATGFDPDKQIKNMNEMTKAATLNSMEAVQETYQANAENTFGALNPEFKSYGQEYGTNLAKGLESKESLVISESNSLSQGSLNALNNHTDEYYKAGQAAGKAYSEGLKTYANQVLNSPDGLGNKSNSVISKAYTSKSADIKSKYSDEINKYATEKGVDVGVAFYMLKSESVYGGNSNISSGLKNDLKELNSIGLGSTDAIDKIINDTNNSKAGISTNTSSSSAKSTSSSVKSSGSSSGSSSNSSGTVVNYTQNIVSPKATSSNELYRTTKTAISRIASIVTATPAGAALVSTAKNMAKSAGITI